jgi:predicted MFS family arabinose efflux permease
MSEQSAPARGNRFMLAQWSELLEDESFRRFWLMRLAGHGATNALTYCLMVFTIRQSSSAIATGMLLLTLIVPSALLGAIAGVLVDRMPKGLLLLIACLLRAGLAFILIDTKDSLVGIYGVSLGLALVTQFASPAESAVVPSVVANQKLVSANSFINLGTLASQVLGMLVLGPILLKTTSGDPLLFIIIGLQLFAAVMITIIPQFHFRFEENAGRISIQTARREFAESWIRLNRDSTAFLSLILLVVTNTSTLIIATTLPKFALQVVHVSPENIVFVLAPVGIAVFLGLRSVEFLADRFNKLATISGAYLLMALSLIALGVVPETSHLIVDLDPLGVFSAGPLNDQAARVATTILFANAYGFSLTLVLTMGRVFLNERIPVSMQGRVFAAQSVLANLTAIVPVVLAGLAADTIGVAPVMIAAGIMALLAAGWSQAYSSRTVALASRTEA